MKAAGLSAGTIATMVKYAIGLTTLVGNSVFNVNDRFDAANNIRYISIMSESMQSAIVKKAAEYQSNKTEVNANQYLQLISYLINLRESGEVQVSNLGTSYEVLQYVFEGDSKEMLFAVRDLSGIPEAQSWIEWRDFVEDKISWARIQLLSAPVHYDEDYWYAPVVTFDYSKMQTVQSFSDKYEYSVDGMKTWQTCSGTSISVACYSYPTDLFVRRVSTENTYETLTARLTIAGIPTLFDSTILVKETTNGYRIDGLDNQRGYEVTFATSERTYEYEDTLSIQIEKGHYSYEFNTSEKYPYVYIRSVGHKLNRISLPCYVVPAYRDGFFYCLYLLSIILFLISVLPFSTSIFPYAYAYSHRHADTNSGGKVTEIFSTMQINRSKKFSLQAICAFLLSKGDHGFVFSPFYLHMSKICCTFAGAKV